MATDENGRREGLLEQVSRIRAGRPGRSALGIPAQVDGAEDAASLRERGILFQVATAGMDPWGARP